ncbi:UNVERIFIED_ORG: hypothetical protein M2348_000019 [Sphingomonas sp. R1F5B]
MRQTFLLIPILLAGCGKKAAKPPAPPAHAETIAHESELLKLTLTPEPQHRLGISLERADAPEPAARFLQRGIFAQHLRVIAGRERYPPVQPT